MMFNYDIEFGQIQNNTNDVIDLFRNKGILHRIMYCSSCNNLLREVKYSRSIDKRAFVCYRTVCLNFQKRISIRQNSFLKNFKLPLRKIMMVLYKWFEGVPQTIIIRELNISRNVISKIYSSIRQKLAEHFKDNVIKLGGENIICQIDESMFRYRQKYHRGRVVGGPRWVFGICDISTSPSNYFVSLVENRKSSTLLPIIRNICRTGTIIWSDEWRSYNNIGDNNYDHLTVNHRYNFVNPVNGVHTQAIESLWNKLKRRLKAVMGASPDILASYLEEWMWKDNVAKGDFNAFLKLIK